MSMSKGLFIGWGMGKHEEIPFSRKQYLKSHIHKNYKEKSYSDYLKQLAKSEKKPSKHSNLKHQIRRDTFGDTMRSIEQIENKWG
jgi:uncharacterized membrane protein YcgQ (UPF0703/DUF1980 family)